MAKDEWVPRKTRLIKPKQQMRFAFDMILLALLLPVFIMAIPVTPPFSYILIGIDAESLRAIFWELIRFCLMNWWVLLAALLLLGVASIRVSERIFGPLHRFETALLQKSANPSDLVSCKLRIGDYFRGFSELFEQVLNESGSPQRPEGRSDHSSVVEVADSPTADPSGSDSP